MNRSGGSMSGGSGINPRFFDLVSQFAHWAVLALLTLTTGVFFGATGLLAVCPPEFGYAAWHEFWWDPHHENRATRGSDLRDFFFLCLGIATGVGLWLLARHYGKLK